MPDRIGRSIKYKCDIETTSLLWSNDVILITPVKNKKAIPVI
ncbi:MAG TPA: hypothetical protein PLA01_06720 [Acetivibrio sp.]|nr:hypothetical protein [Acetivibrio sp.]